MVRPSAGRGTRQGVARMLREPRPLPGLSIPPQAWQDASPPQPYGLASATSVMIARSAASKAAVFMKKSKRTPWAARNSADDISRNRDSGYVGGRQYLCMQHLVSLRRFDFDIGHLSQRTGFGLELPVWA